MDDEKPVLVTDDAKVRKGKLDPADEAVQHTVRTGEGAIEIQSTEEFLAIVTAAGKTFDIYNERIPQLLTPARCAFIRQLRVDEGFSWRAVATACFKDFEGTEDTHWSPPSNQIAGMALCKAAAEYFGADYMKGGWND